MATYSLAVPLYSTLLQRLTACTSPAPAVLAQNWISRVHEAVQRATRLYDYNLLISAHASCEELCDVLSSEWTAFPKDPRLMLRTDAYITRFCDQISGLIRNKELLR